MGQKIILQAWAAFPQNTLNERYFGIFWGNWEPWDGKSVFLKPEYLGTLIEFPKSNKHYIELKWIKLTSDHLPSELMQFPS